MGLPSGILVLSLGKVRLPFGILVLSFGKMRLPSGILVLPFGKVRLPFGNLVLSFGKMRFVEETVPVRLKLLFPDQNKKVFAAGTADL
jgi:hypothetical protein